MSGSLDPAVRFGKDTRLLAERYAKCGMVNVETKIFRNGRHEMLNEVNREEVWEFLREWMIKEAVSRQSLVPKSEANSGSVGSRIRE
jgi:alpha-beta hydrolase superfamily lysophospholipase